ASSVSWTVTFSKSVTGVTGSSFTTNGTLTTAGSPTVSGSGTSYTVSVSTGTGASGTLGISLPSSATIKDSAGNTLTTGASGSTYTIDHTPPTLTIATPASDATGVSRTGPYTGTANDTTTVTIDFCQSTTWTCGSTPDQTATA